MPDSRFHIGLVGVVPIRKRPDLALDLIEKLLAADPRFVLHIRGRLPEEYPWEWRKPIFRAYYADVFERAFGREPLAGHVSWDYFGPDMGNWLRRIGWVLSPSTAESFHVAPLEGMAIWGDTGDLGSPRSFGDLR
nr:glycosyl transferases group 1 [uncultured bacterium]